MTACTVESILPVWKEADRLAALRGFGILDTEPETAFDDITRIAAQVCGTPMAVINFIDEGRQWFKSEIGLGVQEMGLDFSICTHAILQTGLFVIPDMTTDPRFSRAPSVSGVPHLRFYAGAILETDEGLPLGTLCVLDHTPRPDGLTKEQTETLLALARGVMSQLKLRQANQALAETGKRMRATIDTVPQMVWSARPDGYNDYYNRRWYEFTGVSYGSAHGEGWTGIVHPDDQGRAWARWRQSLTTGEEYEIEYRLRHHSGEYRWTLVRALPLRDVQGRIERWFGTCTDIHAAKIAEGALAESEERHRALIQASTAMVWRASADGSILRGWGWEHFSGQVPDEYEGHGWLDAVHPDDRERIIAVWQEILASGQPSIVEYRALTKEKEYRWVLARGVPLKAQNGSVREWVGTIADIHEQKQAEGRLRESEERLRLAVEATSLGIWDIDLVTGQRQWTPEAREVLGLPASVPVTRQLILNVAHPEDRPQVEKTFCEIPSAGALTYGGTYRIIRADNGDERWVAASGRTILNEHGQPVRMIGTVQDVTQRKLSENSLRASEERLKLAMHAGRMVAWEQDLNTDFMTRSPNSMDLLGIGSGPLSEFLDRVHPEDRPLRGQFLDQINEAGVGTSEFRYILPNGETLWLASRGERAGPERIVGVSFDITDRKAAEEKIWRMANHDALTGLPNRALFQQRLEQALAKARAKGTTVSLLLIDLDHFKDVNDTLGHDAGDALLRETATRLRGMVRDCDTVARFGGDEFAVIIVESPTADDAVRLANRLVENLGQPFVYGGRTFASKASIGVAAFPDHASNSKDLLKDADIALYRAKAQGRNQAVPYSPEMRSALERRLSLGDEMRKAVSGNQILPFYQPKVCLTTGQIIGFEALMRWRHSTSGILTPGFFGVVFDDHELARDMGRQLITRVASDMREWLTSGFDLGRVAVNLSSAEFNQPGLADALLGILDDQKVPPESFEVEVTETVLLARSSEAVTSTLRQLHERGVQIALDDFGTGYASLTHLKQFPVDHVKIDQSFVRDLEHDTDDEAIITAVIGLGRSLNLKITAEGVETAGQAHRLRGLGCHHAQGYFYAKPVAASEVPKLLSGFNHSYVA